MIDSLVPTKTRVVNTQTKQHRQDVTRVLFLLHSKIELSLDKNNSTKNDVCTRPDDPDNK